MRYIKLYEDFQMGDLNFMSPVEIQKLFMEECWKETPDLELIKVILDNGLVDVNTKDRRGNSPLHWAVGKYNVDLVKLLISAGAKVDAKNYEGRSPLALAVNWNKVALAVAEYLISAGADVNVKKNDYGITLLHVATDRDNIALVEYLISLGADVNAKDKWNVSPLHWAKSVAIAKLLISAGIDVNTKDKDGWSPLHWAVDKDNIALVEYLISVGADVDSKNKHGESPLAVAVRGGNVEMQDLLKKHGATL